MIAIDPANITLEIVCSIPPEPHHVFLADLHADFGVKANDIGHLLAAFEKRHEVTIVRRNAIRRGADAKSMLRGGRTASVARRDWPKVEALCDAFWDRSF